MFGTKKLPLWMLAAVLAAAPPAWAEKASRPVSKSDLVGTWQLVAVQPVHDKADPVFYPYQRFVFNANSSMKFMASSKPFTKEWIDKFQKQPAEIDYSVDPSHGLMTMTWQKRAHSESAICAYVLKDVPPEVRAKLPPDRLKNLPKKGDITLSFLNRGGKIAYQKILTRVG